GGTEFGVGREFVLDVRDAAVLAVAAEEFDGTGAVLAAEIGIGVGEGVDDALDLPEGLVPSAGFDAPPAYFALVHLFAFDCHGFLLSCSADRHAVEPYGGHADTDGDGLPGLAAGANSFIQGEIISDHGDILQSFGAVADEGCALDRAGDFAVFDEVGLGGGEDELAVGDVDLSAAEVDGVEAAGDRLDDVLRHVGAVEHVGVGHARHGDVVVALAAAGAGVGRAHEAGGELVGEVALEDAVLDEDVFLGGVAFVVQIDRSAAVGHAAVVDDSDLLAGNLLADEAGEGGGLLAVEVGFEAMADGFVQQDAGPARAEDDGHLAGGGGDGRELEDCGAGGLAGVVLGRGGGFKEVEGDAAAAATGAARGGPGAVVAGGVLGDDEEVEAGEGLGVGGAGAAGCRYKDAAELVIKSSPDLDDARVVGAGGLVRALDEWEFGGNLGVGGGAGDGVERGRVVGVAEAGHLLFGGAAGDEGGGAGGAKEAG